MRTADESEIEDSSFLDWNSKKKYAVADESRAGLRCWGESFWVVEKNLAISHTSGLLIVDAAASVVKDLVLRRFLVCDKIQNCLRGLKRPWKIRRGIIETISRFGEWSRIIIRSIVCGPEML